MNQPKKVLYFAENALSAIQGGGIVACAVLKGLPADHLLGFYDYRNITPVPEYADRFIYLGPWRMPAILDRINAITGGRAKQRLRRRFAESCVRQDLAFVERQVTERGFVPEAVYFAGLSYRYLRLAVLAAERYDVPMVLLNMDDWMETEREQAAGWGDVWHARIVEQLKRASTRSLVSTTNSPRLADKLTSLTGFRHVPANNCCSDLMVHGTRPNRTQNRIPNRIPIITYAGAMNLHLQGETLKVLASAVTELNAEGVRVQLHIYTPWEFAPDANAIAVPHAVFYKGHVSREQLADVYRRADFLVTTVTYRERYLSLFRHSLSTKLSEYLCAGTPVISMGHRDWHLHEYVQDHGCGFSILMDENFSRARIKQQLRRILESDAALLERIGRGNRALWSTAHDVDLMAQDSRRALGLMGAAPAVQLAVRRGALWLGDPEDRGFVPKDKLKTIARRLVDVFGHNALDIVATRITPHPDLDEIIDYCRAVGLRPTLVFEPVDERRRDWDPAGARWSLADPQRLPKPSTSSPQTVFEQIAVLRRERTMSPLTAAQRVINQLTVRVAEHAAVRPAIWMYGSATVGLEIIEAIRRHRWLPNAVTIGGFLSSPGYCTADLLHGYRLCQAGELPDASDALIVVSTETSRLSIQEELTRLNLLDRMISAYGLMSASHVYERHPDGPGQVYVAGASARDYASRELVARLGGDRRASHPSKSAEETPNVRSAA